MDGGGSSACKSPTCISCAEEVHFAHSEAAVASGSGGDAAFVEEALEGLLADMERRKAAGDFADAASERARLNSAMKALFAPGLS